MSNTLARLGDVRRATPAAKRIFFSSCGINGADDAGDDCCYHHYVSFHHKKKNKNIFEVLEGSGAASFVLFERISKPLHNCKAERAGPAREQPWCNVL